MSVPGTLFFSTNAKDIIKSMKHTILLLYTTLLLSSCDTGTVRELPVVHPIASQSIVLPDQFKNSSINKSDDRFVGFLNNSVTINVWDIQNNNHFSFGQEGQGPGELVDVSVAIPHSNGLIVLDSGNKLITLFDSYGAFNYSNSYSDRILSIAYSIDGTLYQGIMEPNRVVVKMSDVSDIENAKVIYSLPIKDISESAHTLSIHGSYLFINRLFTNQTIAIDLKTMEHKILTNSYLPPTAEFHQQGPFKVPIRPVWRSNVMLNNQLFQLRNTSNTSSEIYRSDINGTIDMLFTLNHPTVSFFEHKDEIWMFSPDSLFKYPKSKFTNPIL
jgi:hypothetical protein